MTDLSNAMAVAASALDLPTFAYLSLPAKSTSRPRLISNYPSSWTSHYLRHRYEAVDPVVLQARRGWSTFRWGGGCSDAEFTKPQRQLFDEAAHFGIRCGFTVPVHDRRGQLAALTFAADEWRPLFLRAVERYDRALQLMAIFLHIQARRMLSGDRMVDGVHLSPREFECLQWASHGKSAWAIGHILGISRRTAAFHLDNARAKLGVRTICQAVARLAASKPMMY